MTKLIVISAPSGAGKTSIVQYLLQNIPQIVFSISACSREKRKNEIDGEDYYFLTTQEFKEKIKNKEFIEWEEVYKDQFYGTLKSEITRAAQKSKAIIFDVDVIGVLNIKKQYAEECLAIFIMPPTIDTLKTRLIKRNTESKKSLQIRLDIAEQEIAESSKFDKTILNDNFNTACEEARKIVQNFIND